MKVSRRRRSLCPTSGVLSSFSIFSTGSTLGVICVSSTVSDLGLENSGYPGCPRTPRVPPLPATVGSIPSRTKDFCSRNHGLAGTRFLIGTGILTECC